MNSLATLKNLFCDRFNRLDQNKLEIKNCLTTSIIPHTNRSLRWSKCTHNTDVLGDSLISLQMGIPDFLHSVNKGFHHRNEITTRVVSERVLKYLCAYVAICLSK